MSKTNKVFSKQPVQIQNYSGFDLSHYNCGTLTTGTLTPVLVEPLVPADRVSLGTLAQVDLPPLATSFYGRVDFKMEAFFVPYRILMQQWQKFMRYKTDQHTNWQAQNSIYQYLPTLKIHSDRLGNGSLADYLGYKGVSNLLETIVTFPNPLPFLAYHKIYDCWYRDKLIQKEVFVEESPQSIIESTRLRNLPWTSLPSIAKEDDISHADGVAYPDDLQILYAAPTIYQGATKAIIEARDMFNDGVHVWELRQRNYAKDYFTTATTAPQAGDPVALKFDVSGYVDTEEQEAELQGGMGSFTIAALRAANSLQKFVERNNLAGDDYADQIQARFGIRPSDAAINYPIFLGSTSFDVYNRSVFQTGTAAESNNPFGSVAAEYGKASSFGSGSLIDSFECTEHGLVMVLGSLVPHSFYATGTRRYMFASTLADFPEPLLASVGDQQVYKEELCWDNSFGSPTVFGYAGRYSEAKFHNDEVHGELRDGASLDAFTVKRSFFSASTELGTNFLQIQKNALDEVMAADTGLSNFSAWYQIYFEFHKASKLPIYCIPTLGDEKDTHTEYIDKGGKRL